MRNHYLSLVASLPVNKNTNGTVECTPGISFSMLIVKLLMN